MKKRMRKRGPVGIAVMVLLVGTFLLGGTASVLAAEGITVPHNARGLFGTISNLDVEATSRALLDEIMGITL